MPTERYTVLRRTRQNPRDGYSIKSLGDEAAPEFRLDISVVEFDEKQAAEARQDPDLEIALGIRTKLIEPLGLTSATDVPDWGVKAVGANESSLTGEGVVVAVLDTGIDGGHEAFAKVAILEKDFSGAGNGDRVGHGTHCAGTIFGGEVQGRRIGVAPGVRKALVGKVLDDTGAGDATMLFDGIRWALAKGAHVISMSIGFDFPGQVSRRIANGWEADIATSEALDAFRENLDMLNALMSEVKANGSFGTKPLVIAASGNESRRAQNPDWRVSASLPSSAAHLSVAAVERDGDGFKVAAFSNTKVKIAAPGVDIVSAKVGGGLVADSGTSMACPHVAGVAALWAEQARRDGDPIEAETLISHLLANARRDRLRGCDFLDVGRGLVASPR